jgi:hypothetical protein
MPPHFDAAIIDISIFFAAAIISYIDIDAAITPFPLIAPLMLIAFTPLPLRRPPLFRLAG